MSVGPILITAFLLIAAPIGALASWQTTLQVSIPDPAADSGQATVALILGADPSSSDAFDNLQDIVARDSDALKFHITHTEYPLERAKLWKDLRSESLPAEWRAELSSALSSQIQITWTSVDVPMGISLELIDDRNQSLHDITTAGSYNFTLPLSTTRKFTIRASEKTAVAPAGTGGVGGGCGTLSQIGRKGQGPPHPGTTAWNMLVLLTPLAWRIVQKRRVTKFEFST